MHAALAILMSLFLSAIAAMADDIVVYRGTGRLSVDADTATTYPPTVRIYYLINYSDSSVTQILYFKKLSKKLLAATSQVRIARVILPNGKAASMLATGTVTNTAADDFIFAAFTARGKDVALPIETQPAKRTIERPRMFSGKSILIAAAPGSATAFQDAIINLGMDAAKTVAANNEDKTLDQVRDEILETLAAQGYVPL